MTSERISALRKKVEDAQAELEGEIAREQRECVHPLESLRITEGATSSYRSSHTEHALIVTCTACDARFNRSVVFHRD